MALVIKLTHKHSLYLKDDRNFNEKKDNNWSCSHCFATSNHKQGIVPLTNDEDIQIDNQNSDNQTKCWEVEPYKVVESCHKCPDFLKKVLKACYKTSFREIIKCDKYGLVSRSCPIPVNVQKQRFWIFEFFMLFICAISTFIVIKRKEYLDKKATEKVRQQLISS